GPGGGAWVRRAYAAVGEGGGAGAPDPERGEAVQAWIVLRAGACATAQEIRSYCKAKLAPYKVPSQVEFRAELPKSLIGKVLRRALVAEQLAGMPPQGP